MVDVFDVTISVFFPPLCDVLFCAVSFFSAQLTLDLRPLEKDSNASSYEPPRPPLGTRPIDDQAAPLLGVGQTELDLNQANPLLDVASVTPPRVS